MSYKKAMKHSRNPRKWKMTASRKRGNWLIFGKPTTDMTEKELKEHREITNK